MQTEAISYNTKTNISHKGYAQDVKKLKLFDADHRLKSLEQELIRGIDKPKNIKAIDELFEFFKGYLGIDIYRAYYAILDSNDEVNSYAKKALLALANGKSTSIITNLKNITKIGSQTINFGLDIVADHIQTCKDDKGNHNKKALDLLGELETQTLASAKIPTYIEFCKDKDGQIDDNKVNLLKNFISKKYHIYAGMIAQLPLEGTREITPKRLNFFYHVMEKYNKNEITNGCLTFAQECLKATRSSEDASISWIDLNFDDFLNDDKTIRWDVEYLTDKDGKFDWHAIDTLITHIIPELKQRGEKGVIPADILKSNGRLSFINFKKYLRLYDSLNQNKFLISELSRLKEFKTEDETIDDKFIDFVINNTFYIRETAYTPHPDEILKEVLRIAKNSDGTTNWGIASGIIKPVFILFSRKGEELHKLGVHSRPENKEYNAYHDTYKYCSLLEKSIKRVNKGENVKFSKERIEELAKLSKNVNSDLLIKALAGKPLEEMVEGKNLYKAEELLEILKELKETYRLTPAYLNASIKDYDSLLWAIFEAPKTEENKETYSEIIKLLSEVNSKFKKGAEKIDFNQKDKNGISVLEKVINAENEELLDVIIKNSDRLHYYPELDWAYEGVQNPKFKEKLKQLNLEFRDLEQSAELCSLKTFDRLKSQLESPFCDKEKVIEELFNIVRNQQGTIEPPDVYVYHLLDEYGEFLHRDLFNEMAKWQVVERNRRMMK